MRPTIGARDRRALILFCLVFAPAGPSGALAAIVTRGPYLQAGSHDRVTVRWRTDQASDSRVRFGPSPGTWTGSVTVPGQVLDHEVTLLGLGPASRYYYDVGTSSEALAGNDANHYFRTSPLPDTRGPLHIWALGDGGTADANPLAVINAYRTYHAGDTDAWLILGDNAYPLGTDSDYQAGLFDPFADVLRNTVLWPARGNHDEVQPAQDLEYLDFFTLPAAGEAGGVPSGSESYYAFDLGNVHFVCLDSYVSSREPGSPMLTWLDADLAATTRDWVIAYWHHPPYTHSNHNSDDPFDSGGIMYDMRENVLPILDARGVDLVLNGHGHCHERSRLIDGHYGTSITYGPLNEIDSGDGRFGGDGPYIKASGHAAPHSGIVYIVAGSAGQISAGALDHPALPIAYDELGSLVIDVDGPRLDLRFLTASGVVRDSLTMFKGIPAAVQRVPEGTATRLALTGPNPFTNGATVEYTLPSRAALALDVCDLFGRRVRSLEAGTVEPGVHQSRWDGRDDRGLAVPSGVYWAVLTTGGRTTSVRLVLSR